MLGRPRGRPFSCHRLDSILQHLFRESATLLVKFGSDVAVRPERRHKLGKNEAVRHNVGENSGKRSGQCTLTNRSRGSGVVFSNLTGALVRAALVMIVIAIPSTLLVHSSVDSRQMVALVALFAGVLTFVEYYSTYPGLVEFRDAKPFNRIRFVMLLTTVLCLTLIEVGRVSPTTLTQFIQAVGALIGYSMDFPYSPVRLASQLMAASGDAAEMESVRAAAGMAYLISLISLAVFVLQLRAGAWPRRDAAFNVWVNLPTFDPSAGGDVVDRLTRDARINIALGFLLPFWTPLVLNVASIGFQPLSVASPQTLIWTVTAWSFLPASLFMRGIAMGRVAEMIREKRRAGAQAVSARSLATA